MRAPPDFPLPFDPMASLILKQLLPSDVPCEGFCREAIGELNEFSFQRRVSLHQFLEVAIESRDGQNLKFH